MTTIETHSRAHALGLAAIALVCLVYVVYLDRAPRMVGSDEAHFASHAHSIAFTGRDMNGTAFPLFIFITDPLVPGHSSTAWYQPLLFYIFALEFRVLPVAEWSIRLTTALIAILNIWLVYAIGRRLFTRKRYAVLAALILAMTPAHLIMSRQALDYICPLPFVLGWFWCFTSFSSSGRGRLLVAGGLLLGFGLYSYIAAWVLMPLFLALTVIAVASSARTGHATLALIAGFVGPLLLAVAWFWRHPETLWNTVGRYQLQVGGSAPIAEQAVAVAQSGLTRRVSLYWDYFNPSFLFFGGGSSRTMSTAQVGVFLLPVAIFLAFGIFRLAKRRSTGDLLLLAAFFAAPLPIVISLPRPIDYNVGRALLLLPFCALIATYGVEYLVSLPGTWWRAATLMLLVGMPGQYVLFVKDYFTDYQLRAAYWLDPVNTGEVADFVIARDSSEHVPAVYWRDNLDDISIRWKFFMLKSGRQDLWDRTIILYSSPPDPSTVVLGSLFVLYTDDPVVDALLSQGGYSKLTTIYGIDGQPNSTILRRDH